MVFGGDIKSYSIILRIYCISHSGSSGDHSLLNVYHYYVTGHNGHTWETCKLWHLYFSLIYKTSENIIRNLQFEIRGMGDLKHCRSFLSLWLRATCLTKYGGRITWNHLQQRMSFLSYHRLPSTVLQHVKKPTPPPPQNTNPPYKQWSLNLLSHD